MYVTSKFRFWAAATKGRRPVEHRGEFPHVPTSIHLFFLLWLATLIQPLEPEISPLKTKIILLMPDISLLRFKISSRQPRISRQGPRISRQRPRISPQRVEISPPKPLAQIQSIYA